MRWICFIRDLVNLKQLWWSMVQRLSHLSLRIDRIPGTTFTLAYFGVLYYSIITMANQ